MAETYQLKHTGEQIDALLDKARTAVQPTDIPADIATQRELSDLAQTTDERLSDLAQATDAKLTELSNKLNRDNDTLDKALVRSTQILSHNVYNPAEAENGVYYQWNTGAKTERSDIASTGLIACKPGDVVYVFVDANNYGGNITFWDKDGKYLEGINATSSGWTVPDNQQIAYFRASFYNSVFSRLCININEKYADDAYRETIGYFSAFPITSPNINDLQGSLESTLRPSMVVLSHNLYNPADAERGVYYQWNTGAKIERSDISSTGLIACKANDEVFVFRLQARYGGNITFWNKDQQYISGIDVVHGGDVSTPSFVVPDNDDIAYFRSSFYTDIIESLCVNINEKYADDAYREEKAYQATLPIYAPNLGKKEEAEIVKFYTMTRDSVSSIYGRNNTVGSSFIFSVVAKTNYDGQPILPRLKGTSETSALGDANITTVIAYAKKHNYQHIINAGIFLVDNNTADGTTIIDGQILKDGACEQFTTNQYVLGIKADGTMKAYRNVSASAIINDGCIDAVMGFVPLVEEGISATDSVLSICPHANIRHPRQIIGVLSTGDYFTFFCDGRTDNENGMTLRECVDTITSLADVQFAFNLDGGGSSQSVTYHKQINRMLDGRKVPNVIAFVE